MTKSSAVFNIINKLLVLLLFAAQSLVTIQDGSLLDLNLADKSQSNLVLAENQETKTTSAVQKMELSQDFCEDTEQECDNCHQCHGSHASILIALNETLLTPVQSRLFNINLSYFSNNHNDIYRPPSI